MTFVPSFAPRYAILRALLRPTSISDLCTYTGLSVVTVSATLDILEGEKLVTHRKMYGTFVYERTGVDEV